MLRKQNYLRGTLESQHGAKTSLPIYVAKCIANPGSTSTVALRNTDGYLSESPIMRTNQTTRGDGVERGFGGRVAEPCERRRYVCIGLRRVVVVMVLRSVGNVHTSNASQPTATSNRRC